MLWSRRRRAPRRAVSSGGWTRGSFFFQAEDGIRDIGVTGVQTCALPISRLPTGVRVVGVNAGHAFSFVRDAAEELRWAAVPAEGSQFRSRDLFPQAAAAIAVGEPDALDTKIDRTDVPDVPRNRVAYVDGYGNIKTSIPSRGGKKTLKVRVRIGGAEMEAIASDGSFAVEPGQLAFAPGSSGWPAPTADGKGKGGEVRWMELFLRGGNAWEAFGKPAV